MTTLNFELFISLDRTLRMLVSSKLWKIFIFCPEKRWVNNLPGVCLRTDLPFQCISMLVPHNSAFSGVGTAVAFAQFFFFLWKFTRRFLHDTFNPKNLFVSRRVCRFWLNALRQEAEGKLLSAGS